MFNYFTQNCAADNPSFMMPVNNSGDFRQSECNPEFRNTKIAKLPFDFFPILKF
jgi:hypothetical protein